MVPYIFDPEVVDECALECIGHPKPKMFDVFAEAMEKRYPGRIDNTQPWIYSIAGGAMIQMKLYFASLHEYIMIWGTPIGSEGHSGRHHVAFWDTVIDGETWYYAEGQFQKRVYKIGDRIFVGRHQAAGMNFTDGVWAVEYARGFIPRSMPFGIADEILSARDFVAVKQTLALYGALIGRHWSAKYNRDYPLLIPFKRVLGAIMKASGNRTTRRLVPPAPKELPRSKPLPANVVKALAAAGGPNGRRPARLNTAGASNGGADGRTRIAATNGTAGGRSTRVATSDKKEPAAAKRPTGKSAGTRSKGASSSRRAAQER